jgi:hypothetical protein
LIEICIKKYILKMQQQQRQYQPSQQQQQQYQAPPVVLYGIPMDGIDAETRKLVVQVMRIATTIFCVFFIQMLIDWMTGQISFFVFAAGFLVASFIPMCGYYGAKDRNVTFLNFFTAGNACCACWQIYTAFAMFVTLGWHEELCRDCVAQKTAGKYNETEAVEQGCGHAEREADCNLTGYYIWAVLSFIIMFALYSYAVKLSSRLASRPVFVQHVHRPSNYVNTVTMHQQPGTIVQARVVSVEGNGYPQAQQQQPVYQQQQSQPQMVMSGPSAIQQQHQQYQQNNQQQKY